jgi:small GTP-binding protein
MPANLPPQYYELEREYRAERDPREKLRLAEELLRIMPKHKGTDKLQADMRAKISKLKKQIDGGAKQHGARQAPSHDHIPREGAAQIVFIGPPNSGKSSLVDTFTNAKPEIADYPFSTREPLAGMMEYQTVQFQLIDTPPISAEYYENYLSNLIRTADLVVLVCDLADPKLIENVKSVVAILEEKRILLKPGVDKEPDDPRFSVKKTILAAHKEYEDESGEKREKLKELMPGFKMYSTSILDDDAMAGLARGMFEALNIIRIYTKHIGKEPELRDPVVLPVGGTVEDAALEIHKDFAAKLRFAKVWGQGKFDGQRVQRDFVLSDGDVVEFHV